MQNDFETAVSLLKRGLPPGNSQIIQELTLGVSFLSDFWKENYLEEYICKGGSKIKFITGRPGSGKSHLLELFLEQSKTKNYLSVHFSAKDIWIHDFKDIYVEILKQCNIQKCLKVCSEKIIAGLGIEPDDISKNANLLEYLSTENLADPFTKREIRQLLNQMYLQNPLIDNNFALVCGLLTGGILGYPTLEEHNNELLLGFLMADKEVKLSALRKLGLAPTKITKYNARHMLRSLLEVIRIAGYQGVIVAIDDLEILTNSGSMETIRYTKMKREDAYESIRELIDEIDTLKNIMFLFAFDKKLLDDEALGLKSYQALWMRIQNEIQGEKFNRFTDIVDMDQLAAQVYDEKTLVAISKKIAEIINTLDSKANAITETKAHELISETEFSTVSLVRQTLAATME